MEDNTDTINKRKRFLTQDENTFKIHPSTQRRWKMKMQSGKCNNT
jgi:hypothetical protein